MKWETFENVVIALLSVVALVATAWTVWFMYEVMWAFRCAFGI